MYYDATKNYAVNTTINGGWVGVNIGLGIERAFKYFEIFAEYKYRFNRTSDNISISDVTVNLGLKKKIRFSKIFRGIGDKYHWF